MKTKFTALTALLLTVFLLAGCAAGTAPVAETVPGTVPETAAVVPETTAVPETTVAPTEAPTEAPAAAAAPYAFTVTPVITGEQTQVTVTTADEFLAAIAPNTEIVVDAELIDFSTATGYGKTNGEYYEWREEFDGPGLYIKDLSNLTIRGAADDHNVNVLSSVPRYSHVLTFENCSNILVKGLTAGHTQEPGSCHGGVLAYINSENCLIEDCGLFGCGTWGVWGESCKNIQVANSEIYECSDSGLYLTLCTDIQVDGTTFRDLGNDDWGGGWVFRLYDCKNITINGKEAPAFLTVEEMEW